MLIFEECPLPQIPKGTPSLGWRHSGVARVVLEFQSGNAILAQVQGTCLIQSEHPAGRAYILSCMHAADPEEPTVLFYQVPLKRLVAWNKWWHITARALLRAFQKRYWGLVGNYLQTVKEERLIPVGKAWGTGHSCSSIS